jgi:hypothetical protein
VTVTLLRSQRRSERDIRLEPTPKEPAVTSPRHTILRRLSCAAACALAIVAVTASMAGARPALDPPDTGAPSVTAPAPTVIRGGGGGFEWGSAAIGAGAALVLLLTVAGASTVTRHHHRMPGAH